MVLHRGGLDPSRNQCNIVKQLSSQKIKKSLEKNLMLCGISSPQPEIKPAPMTVEVEDSTTGLPGLNHWTAREISVSFSNSKTSSEHLLLLLLLLLLSRFSRVRILVTPWTAAHQASPSMGFSRQEYWSGVPLPCPSEHLVSTKTWAR